MNKQNTEIKKLVTAGVCLALCMLLPFVTMQIPEIGSALSPMHIPVLLCGLICGWPYGLVVGFVAPVLRFLIFGMPPIFPTGLAMAFELAAYGTISGILYRMLPKKLPSLYLSLIAAMLCGRIVWGIVSLILLNISGGAFTFMAFLTGAFINAVPGIICHIIVIPLLVLAVQKAGFMLNTD